LDTNRNAKIIMTSTTENIIVAIISSISVTPAWLLWIGTFI
jgi:hypothetical protein